MITCGLYIYHSFEGKIKFFIFFTVESTTFCLEVPHFFGCPD